MLTSELARPPLDQLLGAYGVSKISKYGSIVAGKHKLRAFRYPEVKQLANFTGAAAIPQFLLRIPQGVFIGGAYNVLSLRDGVALHHICLDWAHNKENEWPMYFKTRHDQEVPARAHSLKGKVLLLSGTWSRQFYHFMTETLAKVCVAQRHINLDEFDAIVADGLELKYVAEWFDILNIRAKVRQAAPGVPVMADELYVPSFMQSCGSVSTELIDFLSSKIDGLISNEQSDPLPDKVYISRRGSRKVIDEEYLLADLLAKHGYSRLNLEDHSVVRQAQIFRQAKSFIAPHGGGMTNLMFARERTRILELFGSNYVNACFADIAMHKACDYLYQLFDQLNGDLIVNPALIGEYLESYG